MKRILTLLSLVLLFLFATAPFLAAQKAADILGTVEFRVENYDPNTQRFTLKPTKKVKFSFQFVRPEDDDSTDFPKLFSRFEKKVTCKIWEGFPRRFDSPLTGDTKSVYIMLTCGEEVFFMASPIFTPQRVK